MLFRSLPCSQSPDCFYRITNEPFWLAKNAIKIVRKITTQELKEYQSHKIDCIVFYCTWYSPVTETITLWEIETIDGKFIYIDYDPELFEQTINSISSMSVLGEK